MNNKSIAAIIAVSACVFLLSSCDLSNNSVNDKQTDAPVTTEATTSAADTTVGSDTGNVSIGIDIFTDADTSAVQTDTSGPDGTVAEDRGPITLPWDEFVF